MFRPLLSSVPTTSFVTGKANNTSRPMFSRNSSVTTSSNASSEHGGTVAPYLDSDHDQVDYPDGESEKIEGSDVHEEVFNFDKVDELNENLDHDEEPLDCSRGDFGRELLEVTCSRCRKRFFIMEHEADVNLCEECVGADKISVLQPALMRDEIGQMGTSMKIEDDFHEKDNSENIPHDEECSVVLTKISPGETREKSNGLMYDEAMNHDTLERHKEKQIEILREHVATDLNLDKTTEATVPEVNASGNFLPEELSADLEVKDLAQQTNTTTKNEKQSPPPDPKLEDLNKEPVVSDLGSTNKQRHIEPAVSPMHRGENTEGTGISVLLMERSCSSKWPVIEGRAFSATNIHCSEPSYTRDNTSVLKRSLGHQSSSTSSSVDLGPFRNTEARLNRLLRNRNKTSGQHASSLSTGSMSDMSISGSSVCIGPRSDNNEELCCNSFDEDSKTTEAASPSVNKRNFEGVQSISTENEISDVIGVSIDECDEKILDVQNDAESEQMEEIKIDSLEESHTSTVSEKEELVTPGESCIFETSSTSPGKSY
jgi:hypothetical protein